MLGLTHGTDINTNTNTETNTKKLSDDQLVCGDRWDGQGPELRNSQPAKAAKKERKFAKKSPKNNLCQTRNQPRKCIYQNLTRGCVQNKAKPFF